VSNNQGRSDCGTVGRSREAVKVSKGELEKKRGSTTRRDKGVSLITGKQGTSVVGGGHKKIGNVS